MTHHSKAKTKERLSKHEPGNLPERDWSRLSDMLKSIGRGIKRGDLLDEFVNPGLEGSWGNRYFYGLREYAEENGFIAIPKQGEIRLTEEGENLVRASELEKQPFPPSVTVELEQDGMERGKIVFEYENENLSEFEKWKELLLSLRRFIKGDDPLRLRGKGGTMKRSCPPFDEDVFDEDVRDLFKNMLGFYREKSGIPRTIDSARFPFPWYIHKDTLMDLKRSDHPSTKWVERYAEFWEEREEKAKKEMFAKRRKKVEEISDEEMEEIVEAEESLDKETFDPDEYAPIFLLRSFMRSVRGVDEEDLDQRIQEKIFNVDKYIPIFLLESLEKQNVRDWISRRLKEDSNFFMPAWFWRWLGFREEAKPQSTEPSHPYDMVIRKPHFAKYFYKMWRNLGYALKRDERRGEDGSYGVLRKKIKKYRDKDEFYKSFFLFRKGLQEDDGVGQEEMKMIEPVEEAFYRELKGEEVRLKLVYTHLSIEDEDHESRVGSIDEAKEKIREGKYDKEPGNYRFSIEKSVNDIADGLNKGEIMSKLREKFEEEDYSLSEEASVSVEEEDKAWSLGHDISYPDYGIKKVKRKLNVYVIPKI